MKSDLLRRTMRRFEGGIQGFLFLLPIGIAVYFLADGGYGILIGEMDRSPIFGLPAVAGAEAVERGRMFVAFGLVFLVAAILSIRFAWRRLRKGNMENE